MPNQLKLLTASLIVSDFGTTETTTIMAAVIPQESAIELDDLPWAPIIGSIKRVVGEHGGFLYQVHFAGAPRAQFVRWENLNEEARSAYLMKHPNAAKEDEAARFMQPDTVRAMFVTKRGKHASKSSAKKGKRSTKRSHVRVSSSSEKVRRYSNPPWHFPYPCCADIIEG
jgi:hypothetical protein